MDPLTVQELQKALQPLAQKLEVIGKDVNEVRFNNIPAIETKLDNLANTINELLDLKHLDHKIEQLRQNIREKLHVEV